MARYLLLISRFLFAACCAALMAGCALPGTVAAPTPYPSAYLPTVIYLTAQSINATISAGITPTQTPTETPTPIPATPLPTSTPTPGEGMPLAAIQINAPGPMSRVVSPLDVHALVVAGDSHRVEVTLFGEDGRVIARTLRVVPGYAGGDPLSVKIPFEIRAAGETGFVQISTTDGHGRLQSLNSVKVLLLSSGVSQINPPGDTIYERVEFKDLPPDAHVSGGILPLSGSFIPVEQAPAILELVGDDGTNLGLRVLDLPGLDTQAFDTSIPYKVKQETPSRLFIYQDDAVLNGRIYVYSQPIDLNP